MQLALIAISSFLSGFGYGVWLSYGRVQALKDENRLLLWKIEELTDELPLMKRVQ